MGGGQGRERNREKHMETGRVGLGVSSLLPDCLQEDTTCFPFWGHFLKTQSQGYLRYSEDKTILLSVLRQGEFCS